jgi:hypothetical protein
MICTPRSHPNSAITATTKITLAVIITTIILGRIDRASSARSGCV